MLRKYLVPQDEIDRFTLEVRSHGYQVQRSLSEHKSTLSDLKLHLSDIEIGCLSVVRRFGVRWHDLAGKRNQRYLWNHCSGHRRGSITLSNPLPSTKLAALDILVVFGEPDQLSKFSTLLKPI